MAGAEFDAAVGASVGGAFFVLGGGFFAAGGRGFGWSRGGFGGAGRGAVFFDLEGLQAFAAEEADGGAAVGCFQGAVHRASGGVSGLVGEGGHERKRRMGAGEVTPVVRAFVLGSVGDGDADDFFDGGDAFEDFADAVFAHGAVAVLDGLFGEGFGTGSGGDEFAHGRGEADEFVDGHSATVASVAAGFAAAFAGGEDGAVHGAGVAEFAEFFLGVGVDLLALGAEDADEALGEECTDRGGDEEGLHAHVDETHDAADGVVGVEGGEDQVAGEGGADGDFRRFEVAHFPDHDDIGVATEDGTKAGGEGEVDFGADGDLDDAGEFVFDGVFDGDDAAVLSVELGEEGVEGGGFAGAGGAGNEDDAVGFLEQGFGFAAQVGLELEAVEVEFFLAEKTQGDAFAFDRGDGGDADVDELATDLEVDPAILGEAAFGDVELGHDLEAGEHRLLELLDVFGNGDFAEATVDAVAHAEFFLHGFDVNIGGVLFESLADDLVHEFDDRGFFVIGVDDVGFVALFQVGGIDIAAFEDFFKGVGADAVEVAEGIEESFFWGETPADGDGDFASDGLAGDEVEGVVGGEDELAEGRGTLGGIDW